MRNQIILVFVILFLNKCYGLFLCDSPAGKLNKLQISGCPNLRKTCSLSRNSSVMISIKFTPNRQINEVTFVPFAVLNYYAVNLEVPNKNGCVNSGLMCPLKRGKTKTYFTNLPIQEDYPQEPFLLQFELKNEEGVDIICVGIIAEVE